MVGIPLYDAPTCLLVFRMARKEEVDIHLLIVLIVVGTATVVTDWVIQLICHIIIIRLESKKQCLISNRM